MTNSAEKHKFCSSAHFCGKTTNSAARLKIPWAAENWSLVVSKVHSEKYSYVLVLLQEAAQALLSAQQVGCMWPNITDKIGEYLGRAEALKQLRGGVAGLCCHHH